MKLTKRGKQVRAVAIIIGIYLLFQINKTKPIITKL